MEVIASWGICNTASLNVWEIDAHNERLLVSINDGEKEWFDVEILLDSDDGEYKPAINYHGTIYFTEECLFV